MQMSALLVVQVLQRGHQVERRIGGGRRDHSRRRVELLVEETREHFDVVGDDVHGAEYLQTGATLEVGLAKLGEQRLHELFRVDHVDHFSLCGLLRGWGRGPVCSF